MGGLKIAVEWGKKSRNYDERQALNRPHSRENRREERCYNCDKTGHFARDCRSRSRRDRDRRRSRSRSYSRGRDRRDRYSSRSASPRGRDRSRDRYERDRVSKYRRHSSDSRDAPRRRDESPRRDRRSKFLFINVFRSGTRSRRRGKKRTFRKQGCSLAAWR